MRSGQEFRRKITHHLGIAPHDFAHGVHPALQQTIPYGIGRSHVKVVQGRCRSVSYLHAIQVVSESLS